MAIKFSRERQAKKRLVKKVSSLQEINAELNNKNLITDEICKLLEGCSAGVKRVFDRAAKGKSKSHDKYDEDIRSFALTLNFYSPRAYEYIRKCFNNNCLPHERTITKWYKSVDCEPGFCEEAFSSLKRKVGNTGKNNPCSINDG